MTRNILSIIASLCCSFIVFLILEGVGYALNPLPESIDMHDPQSFKNYIQSASTSVYLTVLINYAICTFFGGLVAALTALNKKMAQSITVGGILMGLGMYNLISLNYPIWVAIAAIIVFLPFAYLGGKTGIRLSKKSKITH